MAQSELGKLFFVDLAGEDLAGAASAAVSPVEQLIGQRGYQRDYQRNEPMGYGLVFDQAVGDQNAN